MGGAIIKNKLFYFVSAEGKKNSYPSSTYPGYTTNYITSTTAKLIADQYKKLTGIEETYGERDIEQKSFGLLARVDWNISEKHKLAVRYHTSTGVGVVIKTAILTFPSSILTREELDLARMPTAIPMDAVRSLDFSLAMARSR